MLSNVLLIVLLGSIPKQLTVVPEVPQATIAPTEPCDLELVEGETSPGPVSRQFMLQLRECFLSVVIAIDAPEVKWLVREITLRRLGVLIVNAPDRIKNVMIGRDNSDIWGERYIIFVEADWLIRSITTERGKIQLEVRELANQFLDFKGVALSPCEDE